MITVMICGVVGAASGLLVPWLIGRLPEPTEVPVAPEQSEPAKPRKPIPEFSLWGMNSVEGPKESYVDMARAPGLLGGSGIGGAVLGSLVGWRLDSTAALAIWMPIVPILLAITVIDWRSRLIPSRLVLPATAYVVVAGVVVAVVQGDRDDLVRGLFALVLTRSFFWILWFVRSAGMGFGDVRLAALLGFALGFVGFAEAAVGAYAGFIIFALPGLMLAVIRWNRQLLRVGFPFGPFMVLGAFIGLVFGHDIGYALTH